MAKIKFIFLIYIVFGFVVYVPTDSLSNDSHKMVPKYILKMEKIASNGDSDVQYNLGLAYSNGVDIEIDLSKAIFWFKKSAEQGAAKEALEELKANI